VLYGCKTWPLTLREEDRLRVYENTALRKIYDLKAKKVVHGEKSIMMNFTACILPLILLW
jgi:hypothetical protein